MSDPTPCYCDAFPGPEPHQPGLVIGDAYCEQLYTGRTISPHLFDAAPPGEPITV